MVVERFQYFGRDSNGTKKRLGARETGYSKPVLLTHIRGF